ncbi:hypothetical protein AB205_0053290 [Aquarana catesbeiana]|uniref:Uncharacterized protein n=1 Tax=Aquarana catesbeiana TaxID=8400 RepID=A0A2G9NH98_AQUCT|nr:hypothetical protein AB205_0053290 [Aquarana catesbeiana]
MFWNVTMLLPTDATHAFSHFSIKYLCKKSVRYFQFSSVSVQITVLHDNSSSTKIGHLQLTFYRFFFFFFHLMSSDLVEEIAPYSVAIIGHHYKTKTQDKKKDMKQPKIVLGLIMFITKRR